MNLMLIGDADKRREKLLHTLMLSFPSHRITAYSCVPTIHQLEEIHLVLFLANDAEMAEQLNWLPPGMPIFLIEEKPIPYIDRYIERRNVKGYIQKNTSLNTLNFAIKLVLEGGSYFDPSHQPNMGGKQKVDLLEFRVFAMLSKGYSIKEVADRMNISEEKAEKYRMNFIDMGFPMPSRNEEKAVQVLRPIRQ